LPFAPHRASHNRDSGTLAIVSEADGAGLVLDLGVKSTRSKPFAHPNASTVALSRDGQWVASCGWNCDQVRLWNAKTGALVHEWSPGAPNEVFFSPDSQSLIICRGDAFTFWDVHTLQPTRRLAREVAIYPGHVAFSPDGALMALEMAPAVIHLMEVASGRTVAKLEDPHGDRAGWISFTPNGAQLVVAAPYANAIHVWNLRLIRQRLEGMGLDWDWPEFPPDSHATATELTRVKVLSGDLTQPALTREQKEALAAAQYRRELQADPDNTRACNDLAWIYLNGPVSLRDVKAALPLAEKAVRLAPEIAPYRNTLGVAHYRTANYVEAVELLRAGLDKQSDKALPFDRFFLAVCYHRLGETARARDYLAWADRWSAAHCDPGAPYLEELNDLRAEAEKLLGREKEPKSAK
jgi:hypothetical protein